MPKGPEAKIEAYLVEQVEARGALTRKLKWIGRRGAADRLVVWPGFTFNTENPDPTAKDYAAAVTRAIAAEMPGSAVIHFVEVKAEGKVPEDLQAREIARLRAMGCAVFIVDSREAVDAYVKGRS